MKLWEKIFHEILDEHGGSMDLRELYKQTEARYKKEVKKIDKHN